MRIDYEPGEGIVLYTGEKRGSLFISAGLGFSGYEMTPRGTYRFMNPYIGYGRTFDPRSFGRSYSRSIRVRCWLYDRLKGYRRDEKAEI